MPNFEPSTIGIVLIVVWVIAVIGVLGFKWWIGSEEMEKP